MQLMQNLSLLIFLGFLGMNLAHPQCLEKMKIHGSEQEPGDNFGHSISVYKNLAIIGAPNVNAAFIFRYSSNQEKWLEEAKLTPNSNNVYENFGTSVCIYENIAVVGSDAAEKAYVFRYDSNSKLWAKEAELGSHYYEERLFGHSVGVYGNFVVVGAPKEDTGETTSGVVHIYIYDRYRSYWYPYSELTPSDGHNDELFGNSISIHKNSLIVGAKGNGTNGYCSGAAYVFQFDGTDWVEEVQLIPSDNKPSDNFGISVSMYGNAIVVGASGKDTKGKYAGAAYIFRYNPNYRLWKEEAKIHPADAQAKDYFGNTVDIQNNTIVVGAYRENKRGAAYLFQCNVNQRWIEKTKLVSSDAKKGDHFATSVAIYDGNILISARCLESHKSSPGVVYLYK